MFTYSRFKVVCLKDVKSMVYITRIQVLKHCFSVPISGAPGGNSSCKLDLVLVVDVTESIREEKNIPKVIEVLQLFVQQFHVSADGTHVSFATFADESTVHNSLNDTNYYTEDAVLALINSTINKLTRPTRLDNALKKADEVQLNGHRKSVSTVVVLITDGRSHPRDTNFDALRDHVYRIKVRHYPFTPKSAKFKTEGKILNLFL